MWNMINNKHENPDPPKRRPTNDSLRRTVLGLIALVLAVCTLGLTLAFAPGAC